jgi:hypothetical protein
MYCFNHLLLPLQERRLVRTLIAHGHHHLFTSWPKPGKNQGVVPLTVVTVQSQLLSMTCYHRTLLSGSSPTLAATAASMQLHAASIKHDAGDLCCTWLPLDSCIFLVVGCGAILRALDKDNHALGGTPMPYMLSFKFMFPRCKC